MTTLTPAASAALHGPPWLRALRTVAVERFGATALPSAEEELWRYSRIGELDLDRYTAATNPGNAPVGLDAMVPAQRAGLVVVVDGVVVSVSLDDSLAAKGVVVGRMAELDDSGASFAPLQIGEDAFGALHEAFCADPVLVRVPRGVDVDAPLVVVEHAATDGALSCPRLVLDARDGSSATVLHYRTASAGDALVVPATQVAVAGGARLRYLTVQDVGPSVWQVARVDAEVGQQASVVLGAAAFGGSYARLATACRLVGRGGHAQLVSSYFANDEQMLDFRTLQDHVAPDCTSDLLFKGVIDDRAHSVYSGLIRVGAEARGTNANQTNRNIKLSDDAWAESVPNLEIHNNDVRCSHASAVGPIDADQLFYLESRGVPTSVASRLIVAGFFHDVVERFGVPAAAAAVQARIAAKLGHR